jgi:hypothetical protein
MVAARQTVLAAAQGMADDTAQRIGPQGIIL